MTIEPYDSELLKIEEVLGTLQARARKGSQNLEGFVREAKDRFAEIGFEVDVKMHTSNVPDVFVPEIELIGRIDKDHEFDHERMAHEVRSNILDLPGEHGLGLIKPGD
jgi:hypothetical protein